MDRGPQNLSSTSSRLIAMAVALVGSEERVRAHMRCDAVDFRAYRAGAKEPDWVQLGRLVDFIIDEHRRVITENRAALDQIRSRIRAPR